jgi:hypothetical protein
MPVHDIPTRGDMHTAFRRLMDEPARRASARLADALILRDWIMHATTCMQCCFQAQTTCGPHVHCDELLARLLDDRVSSGRNTDASK